MWSTPSPNYPLPTAATKQLTLASFTYAYDLVGNPKQVDDLSPAGDWPSDDVWPQRRRTLGVDDLYRVTSIAYSYNVAGKRLSSVVLLAVVAFCTFTASVAHADEIADLEKSLAQEHAALSTSDCSAACRALASIRRAADKICALEPGPRCSAAHAKSDDATRRVRDACPECAVASVVPDRKPDSPATAPVTPAPAPPQVGQERESVHTTASAPAPESRRGGCASCHASGASLGEATTGVLAVLALAGLLRRKKRT